MKDLHSYLMDRARDPDEMPDLRARLVVACSNIPKDIQQEMMNRALVEPLIDNLEKTVLATVAELQAALREARAMLRSCGLDEPDDGLQASWDRGLAKIDAALNADK